MTALAIGLRLLGAVLALLFVVRYAWWARAPRQPWWSTREGRHLMSFSLAVFAFLTFATVNNLTAWLDPTRPEPDGMWPGQRWVAVALYAWVAWEMLQRNRLLAKARTVDL